MLTLTVPTGLITGSFANPATGKSSSIKGALLRKPGVNAGGGFFLGTNESGNFYFGLPDNFPLFAP